MKDCFLQKQSIVLFFLFFSLGTVLLTNNAKAQTVDCSVSTNCTNSYCNFAATIERGCRCFDGIDNDGDGKIDKADSNCAQYYGLEFVGEGSDCSIVPPGSSDPFDLVGAPISTSQNTADTQSKVSVGDIDGDGIPDAVITSKFNRQVRIVATTDNQADGSDAGEIKADYKTTGQGGNIFSGTGNCSPDKIMWEHENAIADIDGDGKGEIFAIASNRGNANGSPPTCFWLVGFRYAPSTLVPLYNAVQIGSDRPGAIGVADMDGDGKAEVYLRDRIYAAETGKLLAYGNGDWDLDVTSGSVAVNISGDSKMELVCGTKIFSIPSLTNRNPASPALMVPAHDMNGIVPGVKCFVKLANDPIEYGNDTHSMCSVADMDRDGNVDVVISGALNSVTGRTAVFYWNVAKNTVAYALTPSSADLGYGTGHAQYANYLTGWIWGTGRVNIGDANGDGKSDLSFVAGAQLFCLTVDAAGTGLQTLWTQNSITFPGNPIGAIGYRIINDSRSGVIAVTIYDFNNDGHPSLVYRDQNDLVVVDGATGVTVEWTKPCNSHTYTEGPIVADVNGDGATDICVTCSFQNFNPTGDLQNQALGQYRLYYSSGNEWLPTRKVWNQHPYFVVNINDDLTLPFPQLDQNLVFGTSPCPNGTPGPQMPLNVFMNQVPNLSANGCPVFPAPDLSYVGDNPDNPGVDSNGDGVYTPTVEVVPPICGDLAIKVRFNIINDGDLPISGSIPVSFWKADPTVAGVTLADRLYTTNLTITNLGVDQTLQTAYSTFNGTGGTFRLYIVLNNAGNTLPINLTLPSTTECRIDNNIYSVLITPDPFTTNIEKISDNFKCANSAPNTGELRVRIFKGAVEETDYSQYAFQWYTGPASAPVIINGATNYNLTTLAEGTYTVRVRNIAKGCYGQYVEAVIVRKGVDPDVTITSTDQTLCNPPNGTLTATITGGDTGYTYAWYDIGLNPIGQTTSVANNMTAGNYVLIVSKDGCDKQLDAPPIGAPPIPDVAPSVLQHVVDCINPTSGSVTATAFYNAVAQDPNNYTFTWYFYNNVTATRGSVLPAANGTGPTRTGLAAGYYQVTVRDNATQCSGNQAPTIEVQSKTVLPVANITEIAPQTSCDPAQPNGIFQGSATAGSLVSPNDFTFEWFRGDNTLPANKLTTVSGIKGEILNQVSAGGQEYTVKVTTANNCSATFKKIISENKSVPVVSLDSINNSICNPALATSQYNGSAIATVKLNNVVVSNFTGYDFRWHNGPLSTDPSIGTNANTLTELAGGFYTLIVEKLDTHCPSNPVTIEVLNRTTLPKIKTDSIASTNCALTFRGNLVANGEAFVTLIDGAAPTSNYTITWSDNGSTTPVAARTGAHLDKLQGGFIYTAHVLNKTTGCENTDNVPLADAAVTPVVTLNVLQPNGICEPTRTSPPVQYNGKVQATFNVLAGDITKYEYAWRNVTTTTAITTTPPAQPGLTATELGGLNGDLTYGVTAINTQLGCTSGEATKYLPNQVALPKIVTDSIASTNCQPVYNGKKKSNGKIFVASVDGAPVNTTTYAFSWSDNGSVTDVDGQTAVSIDSVQGGFVYTVQVTNLSTGCQNSDPIPLPDVKVIPVPTLTVVQPNGICNPALTSPPVQYNGIVEAGFSTLAGNAADYKYIWRDTSTPAALGSTPPAQGSLPVNRFGNLNGDITYGVIVENAKLGCISGEVTRYLPNQLGLPKIKTDSIPSTNCVVMFGGQKKSNGQIKVTTVDGSAPTANFTFRWFDNGSTTPVSDSITSVIDYVQGGFTYTVEVTNLNTGCQSTDPIALPDQSVIPVVQMVVEQENGICNPSATTPPATFNGRVRADFIVPSGNAADYTFTWTNETTPASLGTTPPNNGGPGVTAANQFGGLNGGITYGVVAVNSKLGCTAGKATIPLQNNTVLPRIETDSIASTNCQVTFNGLNKSNGELILAAVDGGTTFSDYVIAWSADAASPTQIPAANVSDTHLFNYEGGFNYTVNVTTKATGCSSSHIVALTTDKVSPVIDVTKTADNVNCDVAMFGTTGALEAVVTYRGVVQNNPGGVPVLPSNYIITWSTASTGDVLADVGAGSYTAQVVDTDLGCISNTDGDVVLDDLSFPTISIPTPTDQTSCDATQPNGAIQATITVSSGTFRYQWYRDVGTGGATIGALVPNQPTGTVIPLSNQISDDYTIFARNELTGCEAIKSAFIPNNIVFPEISLTEDNSVTSCSNPDGRIITSLDVITNPAQFTVYYLNEVNYAVTSDPAVVKATPHVFTNSGLTYSNLLPGNYSVLVRDEVTHCESQVSTIEVQNATVNATVNVQLVVPETSCGGGNDGSITLTVTPPSTYNFEWYAGGPTNPSPYNFFLNAYLPTFNPATSFASTQNIGSLSTGIYTVVVRDATTGCGTVKTANVPFADSPQITPVVTNSQFCDPGPHNGQISVNIQATTFFGNYELTYYSGSNPVPANQLTSAAATPTAFGTDGIDNNGIGGADDAQFDAAAPGIDHVLTGLAPGDYLIRVKDLTLSALNGGDCSVFETVTIEIDPKPPVVTLGTILPNTSCDMATGDGSVEITVTKNPLDPTTPSYEVSAVNPVPTTGTYPLAVATGVPTVLNGFASQLYSITVEDINSGCTIDKFVNIPDQPVLPQIFTVQKLDDSYCAPTSNGQIQVTAVGPGTIADYAFEWYALPDVNVPANLVYEANGAGATTGEIFNGTKVAPLAGATPGWSFGATNGLGNGSRTYYVRGRRITGSGVGCYTQLEQRTVLDVHKTPNLTLTPFFNTSCVVANGEGVIRAATDIANDPLDPNVINGTYTYTWAPDPANGNTSGGAGPANGVGIGRNALFDITALTSQSYNVTSLNSVSGCSTTGGTTIVTNPLPITLLSYTKQNQLLCNPDGNIQVTEVEIDASTSSAPLVYSFVPGTGNPATDLTMNFDFEWFLSNNDNDNNPATVNTSAPLAINDDILTDDGALTATPYPTFGEGTYYVRAKRKAGLSPGEGCYTMPVRVDISKDANYPTITSIAPFANTSCTSGIVEGRIELAVNVSSSDPLETGSVYNFVWDAADPLNVGGDGNQNNVLNATATTNFTIPPAYVAPPFPNSPPGAGLRDDVYSITVTNQYSGCSITTQTTVTPQRFPVTLISFTKQDQLICDFDGRISVTGVTIDGSTSNLPMYNYVTPADLTANWDFQWFNANNDGDNDASTFNDDPATDGLLDQFNLPITALTLSEDPGETSQPYLNMGEGTYYVVAKRKANMVPGAGCTTTPVRVDIFDKHNTPQVDALDAFANTSCDNNVVEGRIELQVSTPSSVNSESTSNYDYKLLTSANATFGDYLNQTPAITLPPTYLPPPAVLAPGDALPDDTYTIEIVNRYSSCKTIIQAVVPKQAYPVTVISYLKQDKLVCDPDGRIEVTQVSIDGTASNLPVYNYTSNLDLEFDFKWFDSNNDGDNDPNTFNVNGPAIKDDLGADITDVVLTEGPAGTPQRFTNMGAGSYYVLATRKPGMSPGAGCTTLPVRVNIIDSHINPEVTDIDAFANTSCDTNVVEGRIELTVNTPSAVPAESGATYSYQWTPFNNLPSGNIANGAASVTIPPTYAPPPAVLTLADALKDDTYTITITNDYSHCTTTAQAIVTPQRYPIAILSATAIDQFKCYPDGEITVESVIIDGSTQNLPSYPFNTPADLRNNFDFLWFAANNDGDNDAGTFDNQIPLKDATNNDIIDVVLSANGALTTQPYTTMGAGTYYVRARRKLGMAPGAGCFTEPVRVQVQDLHENPLVQLSYTPNTSCDPVNPNGQVVAIAQETSGLNTDTYTFTWTLNNAPLAGPTVSNPNTHEEHLDDAPEGTYVVVVKNQSGTGCTVTANIDVIKDLNISLPNVITVVPTDPTTCLPVAQADVRQISIGGITTYSKNSTPPDDLDALFDYEWYKTDVTNGNLIGGEVNSLLANILPGTYYVRVKDLTTACISSPKEVVISDDNIIYPVVEITQTQLQVSCVTPGTAILQARADGQDETGGVYSFTWFANLTNTAPQFAATSTINNLSAGDYSVTALNSVTGCSSSALYIVPDDAPNFYPIVSVSTDPRVNCLIPDGTLVAREVGYNPNSGYPFPPNYTAELYTGANADTSVPGTTMSFIPGFNRNWSAAGLDINTYIVKIIDNNTGCVETGSIQVQDGRTPPTIEITEDHPLTNCDPVRPNGQLFATADNGHVGGYSFSWFQGSTASGSPIQDQNILIAVTNGTYTVRVTNDVTGCFADLQGLVRDQTVPAPTPNPEVVQHMTQCVDPRDGWVTATVGGVILNYDFFWYDGASASSTPDFNGVDYTQLANGPYTVKVMDVTTGCYSPPATIEVLDQRVFPTLAFTTTASFCSDVPDLSTGTGSIDMVVEPGNEPIDVIEMRERSTGNVVGTTSYVYGLFPGFYDVDVITLKGCPAQGEAEVKTEIRSYNLITRNNDQKNDAFVIDCISLFPNNNVKIFNRSGVLVFEANGYDNVNTVFKGLGENGIYTTGNDLPAGTYFYIIDKGDGSKARTGYLELVK